MKRKLILWMMILFVMPAFCTAAYADEESLTESEAASSQELNYTEKPTQVIKEGKEDGELVLRFYDETPNIPYFGMSAYSQYMLEKPLSVSENGDGTYTLENETGVQITCDPEAGVMQIPDWGGFFDEPLPLEDKALGWKDTATHFIRITNVEYEGEPAPVELDFAKYDISVHADQDDIYLPVSILNNMMTDIATNYMIYNGEKLFAQRIALEGTSPDGFFDSKTLQAQFEGEDRPEDVVKQCYADLCFDFDYFFGHPGIAVLDEAIAEKGLDQALDDLGKEGASIREGLLSSNIWEYMSSLQKLFMLGLSDGHTVLLNTSVMEYYPSLLSSLSATKDMISDMLQSPKTMTQVVNLTIPPQRSRYWGDETYIESGSTAIIRLDDFMPDEAGWAAYYKGEGDFPTDGLGTVVSGLRKAAKNPEIENIIFDLTCNGGGSPDVMMAILAMTTGQTQLYGLQKLTGQKIVCTFEADSNFDGVYDEKDKEVRYDYNYGVLTTRYAFSCGNLFPIIIQEGGAVIIGEPTSGGSCCVQVGTDTQGITHMMSSFQWQLTDSQSVSVEGGCSVDIPIKAKNNRFVDSLVSIVGVDDGAPSFKSYFQADKLDELMNDWFETQAQTELAA